MVKVYSNCEEAELFLNGKSYGVKKRNSQDFPAAGLRWSLVFPKGENSVKVIARKGKTVLTDSIRFRYQTEQWGKPSKTVLTKIGEEQGVATVQVQLLDDQNVPCLDSRDWVRFGLAGEGELIDNQGTSTGARLVQLYNGRAIIRVRTQGGTSVVSARVEKLPASFLTLGTVEQKTAPVL